MSIYIQTHPMPLAIALKPRVEFHIPERLAHPLNRPIRSLSFAIFPLTKIRPTRLPTAPSPFPTPKPHQTLPANFIPTLQQRRYIHVEGTIHLWIRKQLVDSLQSRRKRVCRRPRRFQEVDADFTGLEIHIRVADRSRKGYLGWGERVGARDEDVEVPQTGWGAD